MQYPIKVVIDSPQLKKLLVEKGNLIEMGRAKSDEIEGLERDLEDIDSKIQEFEKNVDISDLKEEAEKATKDFNDAVRKMEEIKVKIFARMNKQIAPEYKKEYEKTKSKKDALETERNKIALKVTKYNDKIIPLTRKLLQEHVTSPYEDFGSVILENGQVVGEIFSHLQEFEDRFAKKAGKIK